MTWNGDKTEELNQTGSNLVDSAVIEAYWTEGGQLRLHALLVMLQLLPLDLLSHFPSFLDGFHHCVLVSEQCRGV